MTPSAVRRSLAAGVAALIAVPALLLAVVTPASAFNGSATLGCRLYFDTGAGSSPSVYTDTFTLTTSPASPEVGDTVTVTATGAAGPTNGPVALTANTLDVNVIVTRDGSNPITLTDTTYPNGAVAAQAPLGSWSATGSFTASSAGDIDLVVKQIQFDYIAAQIDTWCSGAGDRDHWHSPVATTISQTVTVSGGATQSPTPSVTPSCDSFRDAVGHAQRHPVRYAQRHAQRDSERQPERVSFVSAPVSPAVPLTSPPARPPRPLPASSRPPSTPRATGRPTSR